MKHVDVSKRLIWNHLNICLITVDFLFYFNFRKQFLDSKKLILFSIEVSDDGFKKLSSIFKQNIEKILNLTTKIVYKKDYTKEIVKDILDLFTNCEKSKRVLSKKLKIEFTEIDKKQAEIKDLIEKHIKEYIDEANKHMLKMNFEYAEMKLIPQLNILKPLVYYSIDRDNLEVITFFFFFS